MLLRIFLVLICLLGNVVGFSSAQTRAQKAEAYLDEFASQAFKQDYPNIYAALKKALMDIPDDAYLKVTNRDFPVLFTEVLHFGSGQWANSSGIYVFPNDPPTFKKGLWIIKLNTAMEESNDVDAIEGVVLHELAHRVLGHQGGVFSVQVEKDANHLVKKWGFTQQFEHAKAKFGNGHLPKKIVAT